MKQPRIGKSKATPKPAPAPQRLGYKSNARHAGRMSHGNVQKFIPSKKQH